MTLNIYDGQGSGIVQAIWVVYINVFDIMILTETKITNQTYFRKSLVYDVVFLLMSTTTSVGS